MRELLPAVFWQTARHPRLGVEVSSYFVKAGVEAVLFDPLLREGKEEESLAWLSGQGAPVRQILLTNRHHLRSSPLIAARLGATIHCHQSGLPEFGGKVAVEGFVPAPDGTPFRAGVVAYPLGVICPDEVVYHLPEQEALVVGDSVVRGEGKVAPLGFVPDQLLDEPAKTKEGLLAGFAKLLERLSFNHLLLAHGHPLVGNGREELARFVASGGRTAFEL